MDPVEIRRLDDAVVNRIAAGEIIQRPANALKELIENSLDAKSSFIHITVKSGGLKLLQIQDNGTGIRKEDLEIVCERFTTSKLTKFEDLTSIATYGFRGEALASISHVAHLSIQTKTRLEKCAFKAIYEDGKLKSQPKPCAGNQGTTITVEDLFYNVPQRLQILKSPSDEFHLISDVVSKYAVHNAAVGFMLKKFGENAAVRTNANSTIVDNIRTVYGNDIAKELFEINLEDADSQFKMKGFVTNLNYSAKRGINLLFINHRLVESKSLKTAVESVYSEYLGKDNRPFTYISLEINPENLDVNVHPTKHEVHFLNEHEIIESIRLHLDEKLSSNNSTRKFYREVKLPGAWKSPESKNLDETKKIYAQNMVRTDHKEQKLEKFFCSQAVKKRADDQTMRLDSSTCSAENSVLQSPTAGTSARKETKLSSVLNMRQAVEKACSSEFRKILKELTFVGVVSRTDALFQYGTKLYLCNTMKLSRDLFYQLLIYKFAQFETIKLSPALPVKSLAMIALRSSESGWTDGDGPLDELAERVEQILIEKSPIMREYFALDIDENGFLNTLPVLLTNHKPSLHRLPIYLLRLATEVDWESEEECFESFCRETAAFYSYISHDREKTTEQKWVIEHVIYPAFRQFLIPSRRMKEFITELTNLPTLYKVFERC
ncbi:unnamed protein product [Hermetia illucens]|uniref:DNA mismatch repair protein S5 domain-containing protein n=1 Tax=Hermetia illucens TaxID=343691 RepID=A0A7R8UVU8_HERIL|nr:DNA mismatch repair protein Mlh1 [Hermetia illucens]CAD7087927.1 unnamed protein product [Hermetia illucens]